MREFDGGVRGRKITAPLFSPYECERRDGVAPVS
jgi:hypothetical protein